MCKDFVSFANRIREYGEMLQKAKSSMPSDEKEFVKYIDKLYAELQAEKSKKKAA